MIRDTLYCINSTFDFEVLGFKNLFNEKIDSMCFLDMCAVILAVPLVILARDFDLLLRYTCCPVDVYVSSRACGCFLIGHGPYMVCER